MISTLLIAVSGIAWTIVYLKSIQLGFRDKTYAMPLWALGLNFAWEIVCSVGGVATGLLNLQTAVNICWMVCDALIVVTYFKYGKKWMREKDRSYFLPHAILVFASSLVLQLAFFFRLPSLPAAQFTAFTQNVLMSVLFVSMLRHRDSTEGQSMVIAVAKWLGTLAPAIQQGLVDDFNIFIILCGALCSIWDILYIVLLYRKKREEAAHHAA